MAAALHYYTVSGLYDIVTGTAQWELEMPELAGDFFHMAILASDVHLYLCSDLKNAFFAFSVFKASLISH